MTSFNFDMSGYFINETSVDESDFVPQCIKIVKQIITTTDIVRISTDSDYSADLFKSSGFREFRKLESFLNEKVAEGYSEYDATSSGNELTITALDSDDNEINILTAVGETVSNTEVVEVDDVVNVSASIPTLTNKAYNSFINICNETRSFLTNYGEIGQKKSWMLKKTDVNAIAKAIFAPIKAWDAVGAECKMKKEEFDLIKSNLVQFSEENVCTELGDFNWKTVFTWMEERKTNFIKFTETNDSMVAKIKTTVIEQKTKQKIGVIIVTLSIVVDESTSLNTKIGELKAFPSNISFNIIAR